MADALSVEALGILETAFAGLLPATIPGGLSRQVRITPTRIRPLGLGGYVGLHLEPGAALFGRHIDARADISVTGGNDNTARGYVATLSGAVLTQARADLAQAGIQRITSIPTTDPRELAFGIAFEFIKVPVGGEGVIEELILNTTPDG